MAAQPRSCKETIYDSDKRWRTGKKISSSGSRAVQAARQILLAYIQSCSGITYIAAMYFHHIQIWGFKHVHLWYHSASSCGNSKKICRHLDKKQPKLIYHWNWSRSVWCFWSQTFNKCWKKSPKCLLGEKYHFLSSMRKKKDQAEKSLHLLHIATVSLLDTDSSLHKPFHQFTRRTY